MKSSAALNNFLTLALIIAAGGCAHFTTTQHDDSYESGKKVRTISTKASAYTFWEAKSALANFKATQSDKTQGASVGTLNQEASTTNLTGQLEAVVKIINALKPTPTP